MYHMKRILRSVLYIMCISISVTIFQYLECTHTHMCVHYVKRLPVENDQTYDGEIAYQALMPHTSLKLTENIQKYKQAHTQNYRRSEVISPVERKIVEKTKQDIKNISDDKVPMIMIWSAPKWVMESKTTNLNFRVPNQCGGCVLTTDRSNVRQSSGVVVFNQVFNDTVDIPDRDTRTPDQSYIFWSKETQGKTHLFREYLEVPEIDPIFNLTIMFTENSDIREVPGSFYDSLTKSHKKNYQLDLNSILKNKTKLAAWMVGNCYNTVGAIERMKYAKSLVKAGLRLGRYGSCFHSATERNLKGLQDVVVSYKFYLSFENSYHCPGYVTEKLWRNSFDMDVVPIVWGATKGDVEAVAPPNSFIHVDDFKSPRKLVQYLEYLDRNDTAYLEYHKWRLTPISSVPNTGNPGYPDLFCRVCRRLVLENNPPKTIPSISNWLYGQGYKDSLCLRQKHVINDEDAKRLMNFPPMKKGY